VKELSGTIRKGEKSSIIVFTKWEEKEDKQTGEKKIVPFLRYHSVFNVHQCEGIPQEKIPNIEKPNYPILACEKIVECMPLRPLIKHEQQKAFYDNVDDFVNVPTIRTFLSSQSYYATLFHELVL
jgi:antirestriction protein ArdC